ncbi:polyadenylated RNA binding protein [Lactarius deliciosus]|nr:polyadenylated RNA binding protein [Lactarius deliciosus]
MPFGLAISTERAKALEVFAYFWGAIRTVHAHLSLQSAIQDELIKRGYSAEPDPVMAEYITIMIINNKTRDQISSELEDPGVFILTSFLERGFIDWLFTEAAKGAPDHHYPLPLCAKLPPDARRNPPSGPRSNAPLYQQAISQALPNPSPTAQKRTASARSPSPSGQSPNKSRRTDLTIWTAQSGPPGPRSLLERVGPRTPGIGFPRGDNMQNNMPVPGDMDIQAAMAAGFVPPGMNGMDMNAMAAAQMGPNPLLLQEMMMNQMAMMAQMASSLGMMNPGQFGGFPMQPGAQDVTMYGGPGGYNGPPIAGGPSRGRGGGRGGFSGRGRAPTPTLPQPTPPNFAVPERPQSPTLCKFSLKCTNQHCRCGVVLSNEACEQGRDCKDKDCIKGHISPAAVNPALAEHQATTPTAAPASAPPFGSAYCRYGAGCTRRDCAFQHPASRAKLGNNRPQSQAAPCRFGAGCTRATCPFQHPEGRVLPSTFHRGLSTTTPIVSVTAPQTGTIGAASPHKTVIFNKPSTGKTLGAKAQEIEDERNRTIQAVKEAEEAAAKKDNSKRTPIAA